jgi:hypothetical protein
LPPTVAESLLASGIIDLSALLVTIDHQRPMRSPPSYNRGQPPHHESDQEIIIAIGSAIERGSLI